MFAAVAFAVIAALLTAQMCKIESETGEWPEEDEEDEEDE